ncbi:hypothetical protein ACFPZ0_20445, partial [Streptomonospora nanhaiensis]
MTAVPLFPIPGKNWTTGPAPGTAPGQGAPAERGAAPGPAARRLRAGGGGSARPSRTARGSAR